MKRTDAFMLGLTAFVAANCVSYFIRSATPYMTTWGVPAEVMFWHEEVGFPFIMFHVCAGNAFFAYWRLVNVLGNVAIATGASYIFATRFAEHLPPLWPGRSRVFRYSMGELFGGTTIACALLGLAMISQCWGHLVRNLVYIAAPVCAYAWFLCRRQASWIYLAMTALGLTLVALIINLHYEEPSSFDFDIELVVCLAVTRTLVPISGLLSLMILANVAYDVIRHYYGRGQCFRGQSLDSD